MDYEDGVSTTWCLIACVVCVVVTSIGFLHYQKAPIESRMISFCKASGGELYWYNSFSFKCTNGATFSRGSKQ